jgi:hypothetical protein
MWPNWRCGGPKPCIPVTDLFSLVISSGHWYAFLRSGRNYTHPKYELVAGGTLWGKKKCVVFRTVNLAVLYDEGSVGEVNRTVVTIEMFRTPGLPDCADECTSGMVQESKTLVQRVSRSNRPIPR